MKVDTSKYTYDALLSYACSRGDQTFSVTQPRLLWWFETQFGLPMSGRTLSRHLRALQARGMVQVIYRGKGQASIYRFPDGVVSRQRVKFLPTPSPEVFAIEDDGFDILAQKYPPPIPPGVLNNRELFNHDSEPLSDDDRAVLATMPDDAEIDALQASWSNWPGPVYLCARCRTESCEHYPKG